MQIPVIIPSYKPNNKLIEVVESLINEGFEKIIIIRDGCGKEFNTIYDILLKKTQCILLVHERNMGKGRALKTGFAYYLNNISAASKGVVIADADGQHSTQDILRISKEIEQVSTNFVIGARDFSEKIPLRSKIGNLISRQIFSFILGNKILDTQSGLRGIPNKYIHFFANLNGERYEFETSMLLACKKNGIKIKEIPIETIYLENNKSSHFNPLLDSMRIYFVLLRFSISSILSFIIDASLFFIFNTLFNSVAVASYLSRFISLFFNYKFNRHIVFSSTKTDKLLFFKYFMLCLFSISISYGCVSYLVGYGVNIFLAKISVETILFFFNFFLQSRIIFKE